MHDRLSFATAPALYAALWLSAGILLACCWILPGILIFATLLLVLVCLVAVQKATRIALLPIACAWIAAGMLLSEIQRGPDPQTELRFVADAGGITAIDGIVTRATPVQLTESSSPFGHASREEQSQSVDLRVTQPAAGGLRATMYGAADQPFPALQCGDQIPFRSRREQSYRRRA